MPLAHLQVLPVLERSRRGGADALRHAEASAVRACPPACPQTFPRSESCDLFFARNRDGGSSDVSGGRGGGRDPTERTTHEVPCGRGGVGRRVHGPVRGERLARAEPDDREPVSREQDPGRQGRATAADPAAGGATQFGVGVADDHAPCADSGQNCANETAARCQLPSSARSRTRSPRPGARRASSRAGRVAVRAGSRSRSKTSAPSSSGAERIMCLSRE